MEEEEHNLKEEIIRLLPRGTNIRVADEVIDTLYTSDDDVDIPFSTMRENVLANLPTLKDVKVSFREYVNAVKFCTLKTHMNNEEAWSIVFKEKYARLREDGKQISNHVSMYNRSKIVQKIDANMLVTISVYYAPMFHAAIKKQFELMNGISANDDEYVKAEVQQAAAKTLAELTKPQEDKTLNVKVGLSDEAVEASNRTLKQIRTIAENQRRLLEAGHPLEEVQRLNLTFQPTSPDDIIEVGIDE